MKRSGQIKYWLILSGNNLYGYLNQQVTSRGFSYVLKRGLLQHVLVRSEMDLGWLRIFDRLGIRVGDSYPRSLIHIQRYSCEPQLAFKDKILVYTSGDECQCKSREKPIGNCRNIPPVLFDIAAFDCAHRRVA